jgi:hypothetical protein
MIENYVEIAYSFRNKPELWAKLNQGATHTLPAMREGTQHTLKVFSNNPSKYAPENIESLDLKFEELPKDIDLCEQCRYDVKFTDKAVTDYGTPRLAEFKSYSTDTWAGIATNTKFVEQFKRYLGAAEITKLDELAYVVNTSKASVIDVKKAFKDLFEAKPDEIFNAISSNTNLRTDIFGSLTDSQAKSMLSSLINNTDSKMYNFIKFQ